jgi:hypothetical protein
MNFRERTTSTYARMCNIIKRVVMTKIDSPLRWHIRHCDPKDVDEAEIFHNVGYHARPPDPVGNRQRVEALICNVDAQDHPIIVATRDADTMRAVVKKVGLEPDTTLLYTSKSIVKIQPDGSVEIRSVDGTAAPLATKADVDAVNARLDELQQKYNQHSHVAPALGGTTSTTSTPSDATASVSGTQKLRAE